MQSLGVRFSWLNPSRTRLQSCALSTFSTAIQSLMAEKRQISQHWSTFYIFSTPNTNTIEWKLLVLRSLLYNWRIYVNSDCIYFGNAYFFDWISKCRFSAFWFVVLLLTIRCSASIYSCSFFGSKNSLTWTSFRSLAKRTTEKLLGVFLGLLKFVVFVFSVAHASHCSVTMVLRLLTSPCSVQRVNSLLQQLEVSITYEKHPVNFLKFNSTRVSKSVPVNDHDNNCGSKLEWLGLVLVTTFWAIRCGRKIRPVFVFRGKVQSHRWICTFAFRCVKWKYV